MDSNPKPEGDNISQNHDVFSDSDRNRIRTGFESQGAPEPYVSWSPDPRSAEHPLVSRFSDLCDNMSGGANAIPQSALDLDLFGNMKDWLMLISPLETDTEFRYDHYGKGIARVYGKDMTGRSSNDFPSHISDFFTLIYRSAISRRQRVMTVHQPPTQVFVSTWRRLVVPIVDDTGSVTQLLTLNIPENELRAGLEILPVPVLIVSADRIVCYANKQARQSFDSGGFGPWNRSIFDYAGLEMTIRESPNEILKTGMIQTSLCRHIKHTQMGLYEATISAALHHDTAFYVILLQPRRH